MLIDGGAGRPSAPGARGRERTIELHGSHAVSAVPVASIDYDALTEEALLVLLRRRDSRAFRQVMTRNNQRLFRTARAFVHSDAEAEDVVQESYVRAFEQLDSFRGEAALSTWLVRIVVNEARQRLRNEKHQVAMDTVDQPSSSTVVLTFPATDDPSMTAARAELRHLLEDAIDGLSPDFRAVFMLREIEEFTIEETAAALGIRPETVKTRLHRARRFIRTHLEQRVAASLKDAFHFQGVRCARITDRVLSHERVRALWADRSTP
jgi:RNA polymerase sigma factor (sigma-70 family)